MGARGRLASALTAGVRTAGRHASVREVFRLADRVTVVSQWLYDALRQNQVDSDKLALVRHGLPEEYFHRPGSAPRNIASGTVRVGYVGRMHPEKGLGVLVSAMRGVPAEMPMELHIYGIARGDEERRHLATVRSMAGDDGRIAFHGELMASNREDAFRSFNILAVPSLVLESGPLVVLFAALGAGALARALTFPGRLTATQRQPRPPGTPGDRWVYDAFISYRHVEPDRSFALDVATRIERQGFRVAIDARDFRPNEPVILEQERCIRESRFTLCIVSPRYVDSGYCADEAIVSTTLGLNERRRRVVPLTYERVDLPGWMQGLVGIDFSDPAAFVDPYTRVFDLLRADAPGAMGSPG
jgi:glycosyltransferase involved in cell wall biosynthesis